MTMLLNVSFSAGFEQHGRVDVVCREIMARQVYKVTRELANINRGKKEKDKATVTLVLKHPSISSYWNKSPQRILLLSRMFGCNIQCEENGVVAIKEFSANADSDCLHPAMSLSILILILRRADSWETPKDLIKTLFLPESSLSAGGSLATAFLLYLYCNKGIGFFMYGKYSESFSNGPAQYVTNNNLPIIYKAEFMKFLFQNQEELKAWREAYDREQEYAIMDFIRNGQNSSFWFTNENIDGGLDAQLHEFDWLMSKMPA